MTFIIITSGIDLSIGSVLVFASVIAAKVMEAMGGDGCGADLRRHPRRPWSAGGAWGLLNGFLVAKAKIPPLIVTLGTLSAALGLAQVITQRPGHRASTNVADRLRHRTPRSWAFRRYHLLR